MTAQRASHARTSEPSDVRPNRGPSGSNTARGEPANANATARRRRFRGNVVDNRCFDRRIVRARAACSYFSSMKRAELDERTVRPT